MREVRSVDTVNTNTYRFRYEVRLGPDEPWEADWWRDYVAACAKRPVPYGPLPPDESEWRADYEEVE